MRRDDQNVAKEIKLKVGEKRPGEKPIDLPITDVDGQSAK